MKNVELLAPAGSPESLKVAIHNGADAVYLGMQSFNARDNAENFNSQNIAEYVKLAHLFGVKVYLTVNTLVFDEEIDDLVDMVKCAVEAKVDAFLVQDFGVAKILRERFEGIILHASTQMGIHNLEGAIIAKEMGFSRVVLSRETTLEDIRKIHENCDIEMEYFVQGALCVAFSGNCYLSSLRFDKSGNRGKCLQLCRLPYSAMLDGKQVKNGYLLSTNDLCNIERLQELIDAGVVSFKIEGRMRRPAYVGQAVKSYRTALDDAQANLNEQKFKLQKVFSRGKFNDGYYLDNNISKEIINPNFQNHRGIKIGKITKIEKFKDLKKVTIQTDGTQLHFGDGLKFIGKKNEVGIGVGNVNNLGKNLFEIFTKYFSFAVGDDVYLCLDSESENQLINQQKKLKISAFFEAKTNKFAILKMKFHDIEATAQSTQILEKAENQPIKKEQIFENINKLKETNFEISDFDCKIDEVFLPKSIINEMRRTCVKILEEKIIKNNEKHLKNSIFKQKNCIFPEKMQQNHENYYIVDEKLNANFSEKSNIIFAPTILNWNTIKKMKEKYQNHNIFVMLPIIKRAKDSEILNEIIENLDPKTDGLFINNIYGLFYLKKHFKIIANFTLNISNIYALSHMKELGVFDVVQSIEKAPLGNQLQFCGRPVLMTFTHCPFKTIFDYDSCKSCKFKENLKYIAQNGDQFEIRRTKISNCYFELLGDEIKSNSQNFVKDLRK